MAAQQNRVSEKEKFIVSKQKNKVVSDVEAITRFLKRLDLDELKELQVHLRAEQAEDQRNARIKALPEKEQALFCWAVDAITESGRHGTEAAEAFLPFIGTPEGDAMLTDFLKGAEALARRALGPWQPHLNDLLREDLQAFIDQTHELNLREAKVLGLVMTLDDKDREVLETVQMNVTAIQKDPQSFADYVDELNDSLARFGLPALEISGHGEDSPASALLVQA
jgi:hypothetical protein